MRLNARGEAARVSALGVEVDIVHFEQLSHHENRALVKRLEIPLTAWREELDLGQYQGACFVDTQTPEVEGSITKGQ